MFELLGRGLVVKEIARRLRIATKTVDTYRRRIREKLNLQTPANCSSTPFPSDPAPLRRLACKVFLTKISKSADRQPRAVCAKSVPSLFAGLRSASLRR